METEILSINLAFQRLLSDDPEKEDEADFQLGDDENKKEDEEEEDDDEAGEDKEEEEEDDKDDSLE